MAEPTDLRGLNPLMTELAIDLDLLTNTLKAQLKQRFRALRRREKQVFAEIAELEPAVKAGVATHEVRAQYIAAENDLHRIRLDLFDTREAFAVAEIDKIGDPVMNLREGNRTVVVDSRELHT